MTIFGTFIESECDHHVARRAEMLRRDALPPPTVPQLKARAATFLKDSVRLIKPALNARGVAIVQLDEPLPDADFIAVGSLLGTPMREEDPTVQPFLTDDVLLNLRTSVAHTESPAMQPFAANFLTLHSESSGRPQDEQPRFIAMMCVEPGVKGDSAQTVVVPMASVVEQLSLDTREILACTRYDNVAGSPPILRPEQGRWVVCFRDFHRHSLRWVHEGVASAERVRSALVELLAAMYAGRDTFAIRWTHGLVVVLDNRLVMHCRSTCVFAPERPQRHLKRLRIRADAAVTDARRSTSTSAPTRPCTVPAAV